jgi:hypothetical protein
MSSKSRPEDGPHDDAAPAGDSRARVLSHWKMNAAYLSGQAVPFAQSVSWLVRYRGSWWVVFEGGWLCITDDLVEVDIETCASRLTKDPGDTAHEGGVQKACRRQDSGEHDP